MKSLLNKINLNYPIVMGILNITPDSFFDGGCFNNLNHAINRTKEMIKQGAEIIDVGGESTRPNYKEVSVQEELNRVIPVIEKIKNLFEIHISVDTSKAEVMWEAAKAGAHIINDVKSLSNPKSLKIASKTGLFISITHQKRTLKTEKNINIIKDVKKYFINQVTYFEKNGINRKRLIIDPGFGFGKKLLENYQLLANLEKFHDLKVPLLVGISRKSMIGKILNLPPEKRLIGSISCATIAALKKVKIIRTHDIKETIQAIKIAQTTLLAKEKGLYEL